MFLEEEDLFAALAIEEDDEDMNVNVNNQDWPFGALLERVSLQEDPFLSTEPKQQVPQQSLPEHASNEMARQHKKLRSFSQEPQEHLKNEYGGFSHNRGAYEQNSIHSRNPYKYASQDMFFPSIPMQPESSQHTPPSRPPSQNPSSNPVFPQSLSHPQTRFSTPSTANLLGPQKYPERYQEKHPISSEYLTEPNKELPPPLQPFRLSINVPSLGVFYLFIDPRKKVGHLLNLIEVQILELYQLQITALRLQDEYNVDLPPSYSVGSMLKNNSSLTLDYRTNNNTTTNNNRRMAHLQPQFQRDGNNNVRRIQNQQAQQQPKPPHKNMLARNMDIETRAQRTVNDLTQMSRPLVAFSEQPPTKVFQNKEFSCTVTISPILIRPTQNEDQEAVKNTTPTQNSNKLFIQLNVIEQGTGPLPEKEYSVRELLMDKKDGIVIFFVKIRKNSYYGRRPFLLQISGLEKYADLPPIYSVPIIVSAKKKTGKKRNVHKTNPHPNTHNVNNNLISRNNEYHKAFIQSPGNIT